MPIVGLTWSVEGLQPLRCFTFLSVPFNEVSV